MTPAQPSTPTATDRNLLFGVLALQADLIDAAQFAEACTAWSACKDRTLADLLVERGWLTPDDRRDVERLLDRKLKKHSGDVHASLATAFSPPPRDLLARVEDPDIQQSLAGLPRDDRHVLLSTTAYRPETRERYTLTRVHAKGGIGQVWMARDDDLGREVALKEVRSDITTQAGVWARFVEEARITGQLEHPGIVPVYELSRRTEDHRPFYTMRFIKGRTLREASKEYHRKREAGQTGPLDLRELLNQFIGVCNAIAYAHARGVIHRDLKGPNVIVGDFGEVIVLDWGLAKVLDKSDGVRPVTALDPTTAHSDTMHGQVLGTPGYMSPEQAVGRLEQVNERSDVYGLGAILYEILTGQPPFVGDRTEEVIRRVTVEPPVPPRLRVPGTPPALEMVCLKALAKEPAERYASPAELASEIRHYLADEPVSAYREPVPTRLARWARHHRPLVAGAAALLVALVVGLTAGTILLGQTNRRIAREQAETQRERDRADANFQRAQKAVDDYLVQISENTLLKSPLPGLQPLRKQLLQTALHYYEQFVAEHADDPVLRAQSARAHARAGTIAVSLGSDAEGYRSLHQARDILEPLVQQHPERADLRSELADVYLSLGKAQTRKPEEAAERRRDLDRAFDLAKQLVQEQTENNEYRALLARSLGALAGWQYDNGQPAAELPLLQQAAERWTDLARRDRKYRKDAASSAMNLGYYYTRLGNATAALRYHDQARAELARLVREDATDVDALAELRRAYTNIGYAHQSLQGRRDLALAAFLQARTIVEQLCRDHPAVVGYQLQKVGNFNQIANLLIQLNDLQNAETFLRAAQTAADRLHKQDPANVDVVYDLGEIHIMRGRMNLQLRKPRDAVREFEEARNWQEKAFAANRDSLEVRMGVVRIDRSLGLAQQEAGNLPAARQALQRAVELCDEVPVATRRRSHLLLANLVVCYSLLASVEEDAKNAAEAERWHARLVRLWEKEIPPSMASADIRLSMGEEYLRHGLFRVKSGQHAAALKSFQEAERVYQALGGQFFQLAGIRAQLSALFGADQADAGAAVKAQRQRYADQAMDDLQRYVRGGGPLTAAQLKSEAALQPLAGRADFQALVAERQALEKAVAANDERERRASRFALDGDHARAVAEVQPVVTSKYAHRLDYYNAACVYSLASAAVARDTKLSAAERSRLGKEYADRALELLHQAAAKGYRQRADIVHMKGDTDLDPLRGRADFQKFLSDLEAALVGRTNEAGSAPAKP
jgi:serine/threonine-protein kinase